MSSALTSAAKAGPGLKVPSLPELVLYSLIERLGVELWQAVAGCIERIGQFLSQTSVEGGVFHVDDD
jgi:hypothetical protein